MYNIKRVFNYQLPKIGMTDKELESKVREVAEEIRPRLQADGGDLEIVGVENGIVKIQLKEACQNCPMAHLTLHHFIEEYLKEKIPEVKGVEAVENGESKDSS